MRPRSAKEPDDERYTGKGAQNANEHAGAGTAKKLQCTSALDPFAMLPPELRPKPVQKVRDLREVCGLVSWSSCATDLCMNCGKKGVHWPEANTKRDE